MQVKIAGLPKEINFGEFGFFMITRRGADEVNIKLDTSFISPLKRRCFKGELRLKKRSDGLPFIGGVFTVILLFVAFVLCMSVLVLPLYAESNMKIQEGDEWYYYAAAIPPLHNWYKPDFDQTGWKRGPAGFGYGGGQYITILNDMQGNYRSIYARRVFTVPSPDSVTRLSLSMGCTSSFVAYINGIEVIRNSTYMNEVFDLNGFIHELLRGVNVLAMECNNDDIESESFSFNPIFEVYYENIP